MPELDLSRSEAEALQSILDSVPAEARHLLTILQKVQASFRHLPQEALKIIAARLNLPLSRVFAVAGFYSALSLAPKGDRVVKVCCGTACHLRGAPAIIAALEKELGLDLGGTSADGVYSLEAVNCLGACALAPVVCVDDLKAGESTHGELTPALALEAVRTSKVVSREGGADDDSSVRY